MFISLKNKKIISNLWSDKPAQKVSCLYIVIIIVSFHFQNRPLHHQKTLPHNLVLIQSYHSCRWLQIPEDCLHRHFSSWIGWGQLTFYLAAWHKTLVLEALQGPLDIHSHPVPGPLSHASGEHPKILSFSQSIRIPDKQVKQFSQLCWKYGSLDDKNKLNS